MSEVTIKQENINGIPVIVAVSGNAHKKLVLFYHQFLRTKEDMLPLIYLLAKMGYVAIAPDMRSHGERIDYTGEFPWQRFYESAFETAEEASNVIDYAFDRYEIEYKDVTVIGASLGGIAALSASMTDERIANIGVIISSGDFSSLCRVKKRSVLRRFYSDNNYDENEFVKDVDVKSVTYDPYLNMERMLHKRILMINGSFDLAFPVDVVTRFQKKMMEYKKEELDTMEFYLLKNAGHEFNNEMRNIVCEWANRILYYDK